MASLGLRHSVVIRDLYVAELAELLAFSKVRPVGQA